MYTSNVGKENKMYTGNGECHFDILDVGAHQPRNVAIVSLGHISQSL